MIEIARHWIDGQWQVSHPATGAVLGLFAYGGKVEARAAVAAEFGLSAAVFTRDVDRARRVSREVRAGTVWTNAWFVFDDRFAEGGFTSSGIGRLRGPLATAAFSEAKTYVQVSPSQINN